MNFLRKGVLGTCQLSVLLVLCCSVLGIQLYDSYGIFLTEKRLLKINIIEILVELYSRQSQKKRFESKETEKIGQG